MSAPHPKTTKPYSILLIDDDEDDGYIFENALKRIDKSIVYIFYSSSEQALLDLKSYKLNPDCIFLDINMPRMNGFELLRELKTIKRFWHIPIVICTTSRNADHVETAKTLGAAKFISKPNSMKELVIQLKDVLETILK
jgi:CheY-like chemotaxis protein